MLKLIDRYVFKEIVAPSLLGLFVYTAIFIVNNFFKLADQWVKGTMTLGDVGRTITYYLPSVLAMTLPMSVLLGVLIGFSRLSADSEITALRTCGVSYFRLLVPTLAVAILAWATTTVVYMKLVPWANTRAVEITSTAVRRMDLNREIRPGMWTPLTDGMPGQDAAIFARGIDQSNPDEPWLTGVDIVMIDRQAGEARHHQAARARIEKVLTGDETGRYKFVFQDLRTIIWTPDATGATPKISEASAGEQFGPEKRMQGSRSSASARRIDKGVRLQTLEELRQTLKDLDEMDRVEDLKKADPAEAARLQAASKVPLVPQVRERTRRLALMEIHKKFSIPIACIVFALAGMPLGISTRRGGRPASFAISIAVIILWWVIYNAGETWCLAGRLSPATGAWLPDLVIGIVAVHALVVQRRQQAVGLYRALRDSLFLGALVMMLLTGVFAWEHHASPSAPRLPLWAPVGAAALLLLHVVFVLLRDPLSRRLSAVSEAFRRPRADVALEAEETDPEHAHEPPLLAPVPENAASADDPAAERRWIRRGRLEKLRGAAVFGLLAMVAFCVVQVFQAEGGPVAGLRDMVVSWEMVALAVLGLGCIALQVLGVRMVSTLDWWVLRELTRYFALVQGSMIVLYVVFQYLELADTILANKVRPSIVADFYWHLLPRMLADTMPFAAMVAVLVTFGMMAKHNETTAVQCGGVSIWRAVMPAVLMAAILSCSAFVLHDYVLPRSNQTADDLRRQMQGAPPLKRSQGRGFLMSSDGRAVYQFRSVVTHEDKDKTRGKGLQAQITGLTVLKQGPGGHVQDVWSATDAVWQGDRWMLRNGWHAVIDDANQVRVDTFGVQGMPGLERPDYFAAVRREPGQMAFAEFARYVEEQGAAGFPTAPLRVTLQEKLSFPAATLILVLVGLPFAFMTGRKGALTGVGVALILGVAYKAAVAFFTALGSAEYLPPLAAAWAPNGIFALAGVYLLLHVRT